MAPPAGGVGKPSNLPAGEWTAAEWDNLSIDFRKLSELATTTAVTAVAKVRPIDATLSKPRMERGPDMDQATRKWPNEACTYCLFRPVAPPNTPEADLWKYGTSKGDHNPYRCKAAIRWLTEGGEKSDAAFAEHLRSCVKVPELRK